MLRIKPNPSSQNQQYVALKSVSIDSKIRSFGADVCVTQLFRNDEKQPIEAVYCFPIEENAAIYSFTAKIDDREIYAQLKEKIQAQQEYSQALQQGHGAYLMEQDEKSQDIFIISVGALLPGKECRIQIKYVTELALVNGNKTRFVVPTTIAPRYNPSVGGISSPAGTQTKYVQSAPYTVDFRCEIDKLNEQITGVSSSSHPITIQFNENTYVITFGQKNTFMDRDIIVDIDLSTRTNTVLAVEKNGENQLALMVSFTPTNEDCGKVLNTNKEINDVNNEFIFIVDCSGSMKDENKIGLARQAMILFLKSLPVNCQFNIIRFGSDYRTLFNQVTDKYNEHNAKQAEQLISNMSADLGGTELLRPLQWLQNQPPADNHSRQILLLTDGEISNVTQVMDLCRSMSTSSRIFSFGLGHSPSRSLIKGLARSTNGRFTFIPPGTSVDIYVAEQLQKALEPCITNVKVKWNIPSLLSSKLQSVPPVVPPVYANDRLLFYALIECEQFDHSTTVELWNQEETVRLGLARIDRVPETINNDNQLITHLAAKALIQEITHKKNPHTGSQQTRFQQVKEDDNKKRLIDISLKYNILCPHTAFIGIETRTDSSAKNTNSNMVLREIPIEISADDKTMTLLSSGFGSFSNSSFGANAYPIHQQSLSFCANVAPPPPMSASRNYLQGASFPQQQTPPPPMSVSRNYLQGASFPQQQAPPPPMSVSRNYLQGASFPQQRAPPPPMSASLNYLQGASFPQQQAPPPPMSASLNYLQGASFPQQQAPPPPMSVSRNYLQGASFPQQQAPPPPMSVSRNYLQGASFPQQRAPPPPMSASRNYLQPCLLGASFPQQQASTSTLNPFSSSHQSSPSFFSSASLQPPPPPTVPRFGFGASPIYQQSILSPDSTALPPPFSFGAPSSYQTSGSSSFAATNIMGTNPLLSCLMTEEKKWPSNDQDIVRHLIQLQKFDGLWSLNDYEIQNLCKKSLTSFQSNISHDPIILTTVIVVIILEIQFNSFKTIWSFIVNKTMKRLTELLGDNGKLEQLINDIKSQL